MLSWTERTESLTAVCAADATDAPEYDEDFLALANRIRDGKYIPRTQSPSSSSSSHMKLT